MFQQGSRVESSLSARPGKEGKAGLKCGRSVEASSQRKRGEPPRVRICHAGDFGKPLFGRCIAFFVFGEDAKNQRLRDSIHLHVRVKK